MPLARRRGESGMNYWPGFVDALSTLILGIIFLLTVFVVVQFYLQQEVAGKDTALTRLNAQIAELTNLLSLEKAGKSDLEGQLAALRATLASTESERDKLKSAADSSGSNAAAAQGQVIQLGTALEGEKKISAGALAQVEALNQQIAALRRQLAAIEQALDASEQKNKESQSRITELGQRLNVALAQKVQELSRYRSDFFGKLREILGNRPDVRIVGDRFVLQSELFFDTGKADLLPAATASSTRWRPRWSDWSSKFRRTFRGCCASMVTPTCARSPVASSSRTGACPRRAPSPSCSIWSPRASIRSGWSPPGSANISRSIPAPPRTRIARTAASSSS